MRISSSVLIAALLATSASAARADDRVATAEPASDTPDLDALSVPSPDRAPAHHRALTLATLGGLYAGFSTWAWFAWYQDHPPNHAWKLGGDGLFEASAYAGGADKLGHAWATMSVARMSSQILKLDGWSPRQAAVIGAGMSALLFTAVEYEDGFYYEFSFGDLGADLLGAAAAAVLESSPRADELFDYRVEYWPSTEYRSVLRGDPGRDPTLDLKKVNVAEDYSGQTYLLALHLGALHSLDDQRWAAPLRYVDLVVGFRSDKYRPAPLPDDMAVPSQHLFVGVSLDGQAVFDRLLGGGGRPRRALRAVAHGLTEVGNLPFTSYGFEASRTCAPPACIPAP